MRCVPPFLSFDVPRNLKTYKYVSFHQTPHASVLSELKDESRKGKKVGAPSQRRRSARYDVGRWPRCNVAGGPFWNGGKMSFYKEAPFSVVLVYRRFSRKILVKTVELCC